MPYCVMVTQAQRAFCFATAFCSSARATFYVTLGYVTKMSRLTSDYSVMIPRSLVVAMWFDQTCRHLHVLFVQRLPVLCGFGWCVTCSIKYGKELSIIEYNPFLACSDSGSQLFGARSQARCEVASPSALTDW